MSERWADTELVPVQMLSVDEVAERAGMSVPFWRLRLKRIPVTYFDRAVRVRPADLSAYIVKQRAATSR